MNYTCVYANRDRAERAPRTATLTFPDILSDPLVRLVMKADGVDPKALERELWDIAASLPSPKEPSPAEPRPFRVRLPQIG